MDGAGPTRRNGPMGSRSAAVLITILLLAACLRLPFLSRGLESGVTSLQWRETDVTAIARNFEREGMNIFYPRIDWRGTGPGYVEMEFPLVSWLIALARRVIGDYEQIGRLLSFVVGMLTLVLFAALARTFMSAVGALAATAFFAVNPLHVQLSAAVLPEPVMLFASIGCVYAFWRYLETDAGYWAAAAGLAGAFAILVKAPAVHLGLLLLPLLVWRRGWQSILRPRTWAIAATMLLPAIAWYGFANSFWVDYGNSIGISNEVHWTGLDALRQPQFLFGVLRTEIVQVWRGAGILIGAFGVIVGWRRSGTRVALLWLAAALIYLAAVSRTTGQWWAFYYHVVALPPAALLVGLGVSATRKLQPGWRTPALTAVAMGVLAAGAGSVWYASGSELAYRASLAGALGALLGGAWSAVELRRAPGISGRGSSPWSLLARRCDCAGLTVAAGFTGMWIIVGLAAVLPSPSPNPLRACSVAFARFVPESAVLLSSSWSCFDPEGQPQASNMPFFFYWMDRKGYNICREEQTIPAVEALAAEGASHFAVDEDSFHIPPGFGAALTERFPLVAECEGGYLFDLRDESGGLSGRPSRTSVQRHD